MIVEVTGLRRQENGLAVSSCACDVYGISKERGDRTKIKGTLMHMKELCKDMGMEATNK